MRAVALVLLGACSFAPGSLATGDGGGSGSGSDGSMTMIDAAIDGMPDAPPPTQFVRMIDLDDAKVAGGPHENFPLLVTTVQPYLKSKGNGGDVEREDGFDIYFSADVAGAQRLAHEVEYYVPITGALIAWVKIPSLTATTTLYLHYGSDTITTSQENVAAVWSGGYELVMHLDQINDATGKTTTFSTVTTGMPAGRIDLSREFNGGQDRIDAASPGHLDNIFAGGGTIEGWIYPEGFGGATFGRLFDKGNANGYTLGLNDTDVQNSIGFLHGASNSQGWWTAPANSITLDTWQHVAVTYNRDANSNNPALYINAVAQNLNERDTPSGTAVNEGSQTFWIGNDNGSDRGFEGRLDEMRVSSVIRSDTWILTQVRNVTDSQFFSIGPTL